MSQSPSLKKLVWGGEGDGGGHFGTPQGQGWGRYLATKSKVMGGFGLYNLEHIALHQKKGFRGSGGVGWCILGRFFAHFWRHFLTVCLTKKFVKQKRCATTINVLLKKFSEPKNFNSSRQSQNGSFLNRWSDTKVQKIKKYGKVHVSIPRTKGFAVAF